MLSALAQITGVLLVVGTIGGAAALVGPRVSRRPEHVRIAFGILGVAAASFTAFLAYWIHPICGVIVSTTIVVLAVGYLVFRRAWRYWRQVLPLAVLVVAILLLYVSTLYLWSTDQPIFTLAGTRFSHLLPVDNVIPSIFSERLLTQQGTHAMVDDWNGSDRPPLQSGLILLAASIATGASVVAQLLWVPAVFAFLRSLGVPRRATVIAVLAAAVTGTSMLNTLYTWPKMMSAALVLTSCVFLIDASRRPASFGRGLVLAMVTFAFAMLAHGAAGFTLPLVLALGLLAYRGQSLARRIRWSVIGLGAALAVYAPWIGYQRLADPPGDRLVKWHLAGVIAPDGRSFLEALIDSYRSIDLESWLAGRLANLQAVFDPNPLAGAGSLADRRAAEFFTTSTAIGLAYPLGILVLVFVVASVVRNGRLRIRDRPAALMLGAAVACVTFWCVVMFLPASTVVHQGSQVWVFLLILFPVTWLAVRSRRLAIFAVVVQAIATAIVFGPSLQSARLDPVSAAALALGLALSVFALILARRPVRLVVRAPSHGAS